MKKHLSIILVFVTIMFSGLSVYFVIKTEEDSKIDTKIILELWQLDMVEGGKGSRRQFLLKVAKEFEQQNPNVLVTVINQTVNSAEENFKKGIYPHMISYSNGLDLFYENCAPINITENTYGGRYKNQTYGVPWAVGGYVYITKEDQPVEKIYVGRCQYNQPLLAMVLQGLDINKAQVKSPEDAYYMFIHNKNCGLFGTQRDLYRILNNEGNFKIEPYNDFTDIVQYISIIKTDTKSQNLCEMYIDLLMGKYQQSVKDIGLLSANYALNSGDNQPIAPLIAKKPTKTLSICYSKEGLNDIFNTLNDEKVTYEEKIKYAKEAIIYLK